MTNETNNSSASPASGSVAVDLDKLEALANAADQGEGEHIYTHPRDSNKWQANAQWHYAASPDAFRALIALARSNSPAGSTQQSNEQAFLAHWDSVCNDYGFASQFNTAYKAAQSAWSAACRFRAQGGNTSDNGTSGAASTASVAALEGLTKHPIPDGNWNLIDYYKAEDVEHLFSAAGSPAQSEKFADWLAREMPAGTVIADPAWWAPRILRAAGSASPAAATLTELPPLPEPKYAADDLTDIFTADQMRAYGRVVLAHAGVGQGKPDGWIAPAYITGELTSVAFRDIETARAVCADGEPTPFYLAAPSSEDVRNAAPWISVDEHLPEKQCLAVYVTPSGKQRMIRAKYVRQFQEEASGDEMDQCETEYNEADDTNYLKAGWLECIDNWGEYSSCYVTEGVVTHWMPLPTPPAAAQSASDANGGDK